jgi:hypothetical protein
VNFPPNAFGALETTVITITEVPDSEIRESTNPNWPNGDSTGFIYSAPINIQIPSGAILQTTVNITFNVNLPSTVVCVSFLLLDFFFDFFLSEITILQAQSDTCLAVLNGVGEWECKDEILEFSLDGTLATGSTPELGPVAIIFNPSEVTEGSDGGDGGDGDGDDDSDQSSSVAFGASAALALVAATLF